MKDLKYLLDFENLLEDADNALVRQAQEDGQYAIGYTCYHMPEVLLNVDNCFSTRIRGTQEFLDRYCDLLYVQLYLRIRQVSSGTRHRGRI